MRKNLIQKLEEQISIEFKKENKILKTLIPIQLDGLFMMRMNYALL